MPGTVLLLAASPVGKSCLVDAASVLPVLAAVPPAVLAGTDTATVVELADPLEPQAVLTRLRSSTAQRVPCRRAAARSAPSPALPQHTRDPGPARPQTRGAVCGRRTRPSRAARAEPGRRARGSVRNDAARRWPVQIPVELLQAGDREIGGEFQGDTGGGGGHAGSVGGGRWHRYGSGRGPPDLAGPGRGGGSRREAAGSCRSGGVTGTVRRLTGTVRRRHWHGSGRDAAGPGWSGPGGGLGRGPAARRAGAGRIAETALRVAEPHDVRRRSADAVRHRLVHQRLVYQRRARYRRARRPPRRQRSACRRPAYRRPACRRPACRRPAYRRPAYRRPAYRPALCAATRKLVALPEMRRAPPLHASSSHLPLQRARSGRGVPVDRPTSLGGTFASRCPLTG